MLQIIGLGIVFILVVVFANFCANLKPKHSIHVVFRKEEMNKKIVAFIGRAGSGKDYQCNLLKQEGYKQIAFADALRHIAFNVLGLDYEQGMEQYEYLKENNCISVSTKISNNSFNFRKFLELLGTQGIRKYDNDFWCRCIIKELKEKQYNNICISDMRFLNEYNYINKFAQDHDYEFKVIFCDYKSSRYQTDNKHESAEMGNWFATNGYQDLQEITELDMYKYRANKEE